MGNNMTLQEKQALAATARTLIEKLQECDNHEFVDLVLECVVSADDYPLQPENL